MVQTDLTRDWYYSILRSHIKKCFFSFILCIFRCRIRIGSQFLSLAFIIELFAFIYGKEVVQTDLTRDWYYCLLRPYKKRMFFFLLFYVFFNVESESEVSFCRSPLFLSYLPSSTGKRWYRRT